MLIIIECIVSFGKNQHETVVFSNVLNFSGGKKAKIDQNDPFWGFGGLSGISKSIVDYKSWTSLRANRTW